MADVTILGLGAMGQALTRCMIHAGFDTAVWNRTPARAEALIAEGAGHFNDPGLAISQSPATIVCVADYAAADSFLRTPEVEAALDGRSLLQLSTGSPKLARATWEWAKTNNIDYLDGAIMVYPSDVGADGATVLVSGDRKACETCWPFVEAVGPASKYLGRDAGMASALDEALLSLGLSAIIGAINGVALCEANSISLRDYQEAAETFFPVMNGAVSLAIDKIARDDVETTEASLGTWAGTLDHMIETARAAGFSDEIPRGYRRLFDKAKDHGLADHDSAALIRVLRPDNAS